jgi:hypothetical protein
MPATFAQLTTIKNQNNESLVISDTSDTDSFSLQHVNRESTADLDEHLSATNRAGATAGDSAPPGFLDHPPHHCTSFSDAGANSDFSSPEKVEIQITDEFNVPVPYVTSKGPVAVKMDVEAAASSSDHPSNTQLRTDEDADDALDGGPPALLPSATIYTAMPRRESHERQSQRLLFRALDNIYGQTHKSYADAQAEQDEDPEHDDDDDDDESWSNNDGTTSKGPEPRLPSWQDRGDHPGGGWMVNDPLTSDHHKIVIPDPTTTVRHLLIAPYVTYAIQPTNAEVSATYGKGYPIHMRTLSPSPVSYFCPPSTHSETSLLLESPYAEVISKVVDQRFPIALSASLKQYQHFKQKQYDAQAKARALRECLTHLQKRENDALEAAVGVLSEMENANFMGRLFCVEDEVLHQLAHHPIHADHFIRVGIAFAGTITQSPLNSLPNLWCSSPGNPDRAAPFGFPQGFPHDRSQQECHLNKHKDCTHPLNQSESEALAREGGRLREEALKNTRDAEQVDRLAGSKKYRPRITLASIPITKRCFKCNRFGHIRQNCPHDRRPWDQRKLTRSKL